MIKYIFILTLLSSCAFMNGVAPDLEIILTKNSRVIGGTVVYNPIGINTLVSRRRESALSRIRKVCNKMPYQIIEEETDLVINRKEDYKGDHINIFASKKLRFVDFECVRL